jgi:Inner membrane protein YgaP-like, transmembrane domain
MRVNEGVSDRIIRILVGLGILSLVFFGPKTQWAWLGLLPLLTGLVGVCPAYALLGIRTCKTTTPSP